MAQLFRVNGAPAQGRIRPKNKLEINGMKREKKRGHGVETMYKGSGVFQPGSKTKSGVRCSSLAEEKKNRKTSKNWRKDIARYL